MDMVRASLRYLLTGLIVLAALGGLAFKYHDYMVNPWTRDGQVRANVIQVAPRVSGPIVELPVIDNQRVRAGDLLFRIDPRTFQQAVNQAQAQYDTTRTQLAALDRQIEAAEAEVRQAHSQIGQAEAQVRSAQASEVQTRDELARLTALVRDGFTTRSLHETARTNFDIAVAMADRAGGALLQSRGALSQAQAQLAMVVAQRGLRGEDNAQLRAARAALHSAELNLQFTEQRASVDGFVSNLTLRLGSQAIANQPAMALVDENSFWVDAHFREGMIGGLRPGNAAFVTLMSYPEQVITGQVQSIAWGISIADGSTGANLLPAVTPSFEWIRLAQRIPVRIQVDTLPPGVVLRIGMTASVLVRTGSAAGGRAPPPAPMLLQ